MRLKDDRLDSVFQALANPTRRAVMERLGQGPASVTELAEPFDMALPSFMQHLEVLEASGLARSEKSGRVRTVRAEPEALEAIDGWLDRQRRMWEQRLDQMDDYVRTLRENHR
jgi:DNA-binding transcriptional ArsR family regulator